MRLKSICTFRKGLFKSLAYFLLGYLFITDLQVCFIYSRCKLDIHIVNISLSLWLSFHFLYFLNKIIYLFIYFWLRWVFVAGHGLSLVASGGYSPLRCVGFSLQWLLLLRSMGSRCVGFSSCGTGFSSCGSWALERRLSSCGARAQLLCGMWDLPGLGLEPVSPALAVRFLTTVPQGKPLIFLIVSFDEQKFLILTSPIYLFFYGQCFLYTKKSFTYPQV